MWKEKEKEEKGEGSEWGKIKRRERGVSGKGEEEKEKEEKGEGNK